MNWVLENSSLRIFVITSQGSPTEICGHKVGRVLQGLVDLDANLDVQSLPGLRSDIWPCPAAPRGLLVLSSSQEVPGNVTEESGLLLISGFTSCGCWTCQGYKGTGCMCSSPDCYSAWSKKHQLMSLQGALSFHSMACS